MKLSTPERRVSRSLSMLPLIAARTAICARAQNSNSVANRTPAYHAVRRVRIGRDTDLTGSADTIAKSANGLQQLGGIIVIDLPPQQPDERVERVVLNRMA